MWATVRSIIAYNRTIPPVQITLVLNDEIENVPLARDEIDPKAILKRIVDQI